MTAVAPLPYPAEAPFLATAAFSWISCSSMPGCIASGAGSYAFNFINSFTTASVKAFGGGLNAPVLLGSTPLLTFSDADAPMRGHLARVADPSEMLVVWHSAHADADAAVQWGLSPGAYSGRAASEPNTYAREDLCGFPTSVATSVGWSEPHFWHYARITGLAPGSAQTVYYRYGSDSHGWSGELSFRAPPAPATGPNHIIMIADMGMTPYDGTQNHWQEPDAGMTTQHMIDFAQSGSGYDYSLALHAGDIVYSTGYALKWNLFNSRLDGLADVRWCMHSALPHPRGGDTASYAPALPHSLRSTTHLRPVPLLALYSVSRTSSARATTVRARRGVSSTTSFGDLLPPRSFPPFTYPLTSLRRARLAWLGQLCLCRFWRRVRHPDADALPLADAVVAHAGPGLVGAQARPGHVCDDEH